MSLNYRRPGWLLRVVILTKRRRIGWEQPTGLFVNGRLSSVKTDSYPKGAPQPEAEEFRQLKKENKQLRMENEILKKRRRTLPGSRCEVRLDQRTRQGIYGGFDVSGSPGQRRRLLRPAKSQTVGSTATPGKYCI